MNRKKERSLPARNIVLRFVYFILFDLFQWQVAWRAARRRKSLFYESLKNLIMLIYCTVCSFNRFQKQLDQNK